MSKVQEILKEAKALVKAKKAAGWTREDFANALKEMLEENMNYMNLSNEEADLVQKHRKTVKETVSLTPDKEIHVMGSEDILCTIVQGKHANDMEISFEWSAPSVTVEIVQGEHGPYLVVKAHY